MTTPAMNDGAVIEVFQGDSRRIIQFAPARVGLIWRFLLPLSGAPVQQILQEYDYDLLAPGTRARAPYLVPYYILAGAMRCIVEDIFGSSDWQQHWASGGSDRRRNDTFWVEVLYRDSRRIIQLMPTQWQIEWQLVISLTGAPGEDLVEDDHFVPATGACLTAEGALDQAMRHLVDDLNDSAEWQQYWGPWEELGRGALPRARIAPGTSPGKVFWLGQRPPRLRSLPHERALRRTWPRSGLLGPATSRHA